MARINQRINRETSQIIRNLWKTGYPTRYIVDNLAKVGVHVSMQIVRNHGRRGDDLFRKRTVKPHKVMIVFTVIFVFLF